MVVSCKWEWLGAWSVWLGSGQEEYAGMFAQPVHAHERAVARCLGSIWQASAIRAKFSCFLFSFLSRPGLPQRLSLHSPAWHYGATAAPYNPQSPALNDRFCNLGSEATLGVGTGRGRVGWTVVHHRQDVACAEVSSSCTHKGTNGMYHSFQVVICCLLRQALWTTSP